MALTRFSFTELYSKFSKDLASVSDQVQVKEWYEPEAGLSIEIPLGVNSCSRVPTGRDTSPWDGLVLPSSLTPQSNQDLVAKPTLLSGEAVFQDGTQLLKQVHLQLFLTGIPLTFQKAKGFA